MESFAYWATASVFLLCLVLSLAVGVGFLSSRSIKTNLERSFLSIVLLITLWNFLSIAEQLPWNQTWKYSLFQISSPIWIFFGYCIYDFLRLISQTPRGKVSNYLFFTAAIFSLMGIFTNLVELKVVVGPYGTYAAPGILQIPIFLLVECVALVVGMFHVYQAIPRSAPEERKALQLVFWTTPIVVFLPIIFSVLLPALDLSSLIKIGTSGFTILMVAYYYAALSRADVPPSISQAAQSLFHEMRDGIILTDLDGRIEQVNPAALCLMGLDEANILGEIIEKYIPHFRQDLWYQDFPIEMKHLDGSVHSFCITAILQKNKGIPSGKLLILRDTTDLTDIQKNLDVVSDKISDHHAAERILALKEAQERIRSREQQLQAILDNLPFQVYVKNTSGRYILQNKMDRECRGTLLGHHLQETPMTSERVEQGISADKRVLQGEEVETSYESTQLGKIVQLRSIKRPIRNEDGTIEGILGILMDITDHHRLEQERMDFKERLMHSHKMEAIGTLAGGIAHDFNNILGSLTGYCELATETIPQDSPAQKYLKEVLVASERGRQLVQEVLAFSRKEDKDRKPVATCFTIKETLNLLKGSIPKNIRTRIQLPAQELFILGDPVELHRIVMNLCTNAIHAMKEQGGTLTVLCESMRNDTPIPLWNTQLPAGAWICLEIRDTGHGIEESKLSRIFDPFFTTKKTSEGTGLGLSVVLGILQAWNAVVAVKSKVNEGTAFRICIPSLHRNQRSTDSNVQNSIPILLHIANTELGDRFRSAVGDRQIQWQQIRSIDDIPRLWRVNPWKIGVINQHELDLPFELLIQQWRAQGIQSPFLVFVKDHSSLESNDLHLLDRVFALPVDAQVDQIRDALQRFLW